MSKKQKNRLLIIFLATVTAVSVFITYYNSVILSNFEIVNTEKPNILVNPELICPDSSPTFLGFFDLSVAPELLFYSYIPAILISISFGIYVFVKSNKSLLGKLVLSISLVFSLWTIDLIIQWISVYVNYDFFFWQTTPLLEVSIPILAIYFVYSFANTKDLSFSKKILLSIPYLIMCIHMPTKYNVTSFDLLNCQGNFSNFYYYIYSFEAFAIFIVGYITLKKIYDKNISDPEKTQIALVGFSSVIFLSIFTITNIFGEVTKIYEINLFGPIGMVLFISSLSYMTIKYNIFNTKILATQMLVISLIILIASKLLVNDPFYSQIITALTLILVTGLGYSLTKSVKNDVEQRQKIEKLAFELEKTNLKLHELDQMKSEFLSLATHQIRAPLTAIKGYASMLSDGDFGELPPKAKNSSQIINKSCENLINIVNDFLNISRIEQGRMVYDKNEEKLDEILKEVVEGIKPNIQDANLKLDFKIEEGVNYTVLVDKGKMNQIIGNVIDNSIKYTKRGYIHISLGKEGGVLKIKIKDSGVGIDPSEIDKLFTKFSRTKDASRVSVTGTGLGLYIAKKMMNDMGGDIKVYSEGKDKGAEFIIEI